MLEIQTTPHGLLGSVKGHLGASDIQRLNDVELLDLDDVQLSAPLRVAVLRELGIGRCRQPLFTMVRRESLLRLRALRIGESAEVLTDVPALGELPDLQVLTLRRPVITDDLANWIIRQETVTYLALDETNVSDSLVYRLGCKQRLRWLRVWRTDVSFKKPDALPEPFPLVQHLVVSETKVSRDSIPMIRWLFPNLERLFAGQTQLCKSDIEEIASWENLTVLETGTPGVDFNRTGQHMW